MAVLTSTATSFISEVHHEVAAIKDHPLGMLHLCCLSQPLLGIAEDSLGGGEIGHWSLNAHGSDKLSIADLFQCGE